MKELAAKHRRFGLPRLHAMLRGEGLVVNHKRSERIYREERLSLRTKKRRRMDFPQFYRQLSGLPTLL